MKTENKANTNTGHGHVWQRPDGIKHRCGGVAMCKECQKDAASIQMKTENELKACPITALSEGIEQKMKDWRLSLTQDDSGNGFPLTDALSAPGMDIGSGYEEINLLHDEIMSMAESAFNMSEPTPSPDRQAALDALDVICDASFCDGYNAGFNASPTCKDECHPATEPARHRFCFEKPLSSVTKAARKTIKDSLTAYEKRKEGSK